MPAITDEEVERYTKPQCEKEMRDRISAVKEIKDKWGGFEGIADNDDTRAVQQYNVDLQKLGDRLQALREAEEGGQKADSWQSFLDSPAGGMQFPGGGNGDGGAKKKVLRDAAKQFVESKAYEQYRETKVQGIEAEVSIASILPEYVGLELKGYKAPGMKATLGTDSSLADVDTEFPPENIRSGVMVEELFQTPNVADLFPQATTGQNAVPFMNETVNDTGAAETAEGALAPEASITFSEDSAPVRKIPVFLPVTDEILEDESFIRGHINGRLPLFIRLREDNQLINGDGVAPNLTGILNLSGTDSSTGYATSDSAQTKLETIFTAGMRVMESFLMPDASLMGLSLWEELRLAKDANNNYLLAPITDNATPRVFGWRVVFNQNMPDEPTSTGVTNTTIIVGAFSQASQIWRRTGITLAVSDSHSDFFQRMQLAIRASTRLAITHYRPAGYALVEATA